MIFDTASCLDSNDSLEYFLAKYLHMKMSEVS